MKELIKNQGENYIGNWTLNCYPLDKKYKYLGKLHISDKGIYFEAQFDSSMKGLLNDILTSAVVVSGHSLLVSDRILKQWEEKGYLHVQKSDIKNIESTSSLFKKTVIITLKDDKQIIFDYGMLSVKKIENAIRLNF